MLDAEANRERSSDSRLTVSYARYPSLFDNPDEGERPWSRKGLPRGFISHMTALALRDLQPKRSWLFWLGSLISLSAAVISAALNAYAVQWLMPHGTARILGIAASVVLDAWKVLTPVLVVVLLQGRMWVAAGFCGLIGLIPFAISFSMAASFSVVTRADGVTQRSVAAESRQDLRAELQRQEAQLKALGTPRPVAVVQAELQGQAVPPSIWRDSNECRVLMQGRLKVNVDPWIARLVLAPRLSAFLTSHPLLSLELLVRDSLGDLVSEGVDEAPATRRLVSRAQIQTSCARHGPSSPKESASSR
jgi:hypothetical protein